MGTFLRSRHPLDDEQAFVQGAGRLLLADITDALYAYPDGIEDLLDLGSGATQYDAMAPWFDAGFTKTGINVSRNHAEDTFDVDQSTGAIRRRPNNWEMSVGTQLAEGTLETFQLVGVPQGHAQRAGVGHDAQQDRRSGVAADQPQLRGRSDRLDGCRFWRDLRAGAGTVGDASEQVTDNTGDGSEQRRVPAPLDQQRRSMGFDTDIQRGGSQKMAVASLLSIGVTSG
jgi:hypothetical protein